MIDTTGASWRTSSYTNGGGQCVEVADLPSGGHLVRDTKDHGRGPTLRFTPAEWAIFVADVRAGAFDA